ncbi:fungal-specific transcription factor domain-containing protein [Roridomyces roridus]|uniref:Fungal-specific transcription factor domain-containing protein n=1 Tax=Roridomyces roridus TaxID=1738132 RepID=A0AAD7BQL6_9AGAR|nr:fungal-specific transcription factor domain-containing protein [Roridomyces roridus]
MSTPQLSNSKSRRVLSCDNCRQRKVRCNGNSMPEHQCSNCLSFGGLCTYAEPTSRRTKNRLVEELQRKVAILEAKLRALSVCSLCSAPLQSSFDPDGAPTPESETPVLDEYQDDEEEDEDVKELTGQFKNHFFGSDSTFNLVHSAIATKEKYLGRPGMPDMPQRAMNWAPYPWEQDFYYSRPSYICPPPDLMYHLIELYFKHVHPIFPLLHRPLLERHVQEELHTRDPSFEAVLMALFGIASRYSDDPRVMIDGQAISSGWMFVSQIRMLPNFAEPTVHDVQFYCLMTLYCWGGTAPHLTWSYLGIGARLIQYHRRYSRSSGTPEIEDELWNRAFWSIFILDGMLSSFLGRTPTIHVEEYDVLPPLEVDDEYWDSAFLQPAGKPSNVSFFKYLVQLLEILAKTLHRLYASKTMKARMGWTPEDEMNTVAELDSAMNEFIDSLPEHLRWPGAQGVFYEQSALLYATYYGIQITIHRLYIHKRSPVSGPSLYICLTAARSTIGVAQTWMETTGRTPSTWFFQSPTFIGAIMLLLNIFATKRAAAARRVDVDKDFALVGAAIRIVRTNAGRWRAAARMVEILEELQSLDEHLSAPRHDQFQTASAEYVLPTPGEVHSQTASGFRPGTSIEQLLDETSVPADMADTELMSMWLAAPVAVENHMNLTQWQAYIDKMPVVDQGWVDGE